MNLDLRTLTVILSLTFFTQMVAMAVQYRLDRSQRGIRWWLVGPALMALGLALMPLVVSPTYRILATFANPLVLLGQVFLLVGVVQFFGRKPRTGLLAGLYLVFLLSYNYMIYVHNSISGRTIVISFATAVVMAMTAYELLLKSRRPIPGSCQFTAAIFLVHGGYHLVAIVPTLLAPPVQSYAQLTPLSVFAFILPAITSTLWSYGFILMVNQRLLAENREEKETYRSILNASPDDITITDLQGRILMTSPAAERMFGHGPGGGIGMAITAFLVPEDVARAQANIGLLFRGGNAFQNVYRAVRRDGVVLDIEVSSSLILGADGRPVKLVFVVRDITERVRAEAENAALLARNSQLQKAESLARMAGAVAHHFNNRLQAVMGSLELIRSLDPEPAIAARLEIAQQATLRAAEVSRLMLAYLGQLPSEKEALQLFELCRGFLPVLQAGLPEAIRFDVEGPSEGPQVRAVAGQLQEVLSNLTTNAWEAIGAQAGSIQLRLGTCAAAAIPVQNRYPLDWRPQAADYAFIEVADSGAGIPPADLAQLFDPFFSTKFTGRGLGLPVVLGIVQGHAGAVTVAARAGGGSVFTVYLPVL